MKSIAGSVAVLLLCGPVASAADPPRVYTDQELLSEFEFTPEVRRILDGGGHDAKMGFNYLRYARALRSGGAALDAVVAPDIKLNDLEPAGFKGLAGLKQFRAQANAAASYERAVVRSMKFPAPDITEIELCTERKDSATGAMRTSVIHARDRWVDDKVVERWHRPERLPDGTSCGPPNRTP